MLYLYNIYIILNTKFQSFFFKMAHNVDSWKRGFVDLERLVFSFGRFLMSPEGRNVKYSYPLGLEVAAVLGLTVIHRELQRHLYPAANLQLQLLRSLGKVAHRLAGNGVDAVAQHVGLAHFLRRPEIFSAPS